MHPRLRRLFAGAGAACLTLSALCFATEGALQAAPLLAVRLHLPFSVPTLAVEVRDPAVPPPVPVVGSPGPAPSISPSPTPAPRKRGTLGDGPIVFKGTGTYQLGINRSSRNGLSTGYDNYNSSVGIGVERRTEASALSISSAFGYGGGNLGIGSMIVGYRTPRYGLTYGQVTGPSDSQLSIGGFARGVGLSIPQRNGELSLLASTANQELDNGTTYRIFGLQRDWTAFGGYVSAAGYYGASEQGSGREAVADLSFRRYGAKLSTDSEIALSHATGIDGTPRGTHLAGAFQADLQGRSVFTTAQIRFDPVGFQTLTGTLDGGLSASLAIRKHSERFGDINVSLQHLDDKLAGTTSHDDRVTLTGSRSWGNVGLQYVTGIDSQRGDGGGTLQHTSALSFSESLRGFSFFQTLQASSTTGSTGTASQRQVALGLSRSAFGGAFAYQLTRGTQQGDGGTGTDLSHVISFHRPIGKKLDVQLIESLERSDNSGVPATLTETTIGLTRRISSVVAVQVAAGTFRQTGLGGGRGSLFSASLVGPFGFGQQPNVGRANPNLPAVIRGLVTFSTSPNPFGYNQSPTRGFNNALVVLDGKVTQRTDSAGEFEFRFVPAGTHTLRIDPATISPGLIADREYATVTVMGGQTTTVQFNVGNFAGVSGSVAATERSGQKRPLGGVGIAIDGVQVVTTTADGHYQVGRLTAGPHTVAVVETTIPSNVAFIEDKKKTVTVTPGTSATVNFSAVPLGSISGSVLAPGGGGFGPLAGLHNVYVVADPGDRAVITDDDGSFIIDNVPSGTYTLSIDKDTIPDGLSILSAPEGPITVIGGSSVQGLTFKLGAGAKDVVFTFNDGRKQSIQVDVEPGAAPPGALLRIRATTNAKDVKGLFLESDVFGTVALRHDPKLSAWFANAIVPSLTKGAYALSVTARRSDVKDGEALVAVDPAIPLVAVRISPAAPAPGQSAKITLKSLTGLEEGDTVLFEDGYKVQLPRPTGRVFTFDIRVWRKGLPYAATLVSKRGTSYPLILR